MSNIFTLENDLLSMEVNKASSVLDMTLSMYTMESKLGKTFLENSDTSISKIIVSIKDFFVKVIASIESFIKNMKIRIQRFITEKKLKTKIEALKNSAESMDASGKLAPDYNKILLLSTNYTKLLSDVIDNFHGERKYKFVSQIDDDLQKFDDLMDKMEEDITAVLNTNITWKKKDLIAFYEKELTGQQHVFKNIDACTYKFQQLQRESEKMQFMRDWCSDESLIPKKANALKRMISKLTKGVTGIITKIIIAFCALI